MILLQSIYFYEYFMQKYNSIPTVLRAVKIIYIIS